MPSDDWWAANEPLFAGGEVDALEWSIDFGWAGSNWGAELAAPDWVRTQLAAFSARDRLYAHGVELSPMSAHWTAQHRSWLDGLERTCQHHRYRHLTEHYGFITAGDFVRGTPLPMPPSGSALELARKGMEAMARRSGLPVGIENLAFAFSRRDVDAQAAFLGRLLDEVEGFLLLDVHNLYCQAYNFGLDALELAAALPLERVREMHVAGGSWNLPRSDPDHRPFRRDSHDDATPQEVVELVGKLVGRCPALEVVIVERSDRSLFGRAEAARHREDFLALKEIVRSATEAQQQASPAEIEWTADTTEELSAYQSCLLDSFSRRLEPEEAKALLLEGSPYSDYIASFEPRAVEIAQSLVQQWAGRGEPTDSMAAAVLGKIGGPLELRSLPTMVPGPTQVLIRVAAVGLCGTDVHAVEGRFPVPMPIVLGHETVGTIEAVGSEVRGRQVGERVGVSWIQSTCGACPACTRAWSTRCSDPRTWIENGGGLSEWVVAEASGCTVLPDSVPFTEAAPLFCAGHVAMSALLRGKPQPGERVAVLGLGGLGHLALQIAKARGFEVVAVSRSANKLADARELFGADEVVAFDSDAGEALQSAGGADVIVATTTDMEQVSRAVQGLRLGGRLVTVGLGEGSLVIDPVDLVQREASVVGAVQGNRDELDAVLALAASGTVRPRVETFPLLLVQRALTRLAEGRARYRVVVTL